MTLRVALAGAGWVSAHHLAAWRAAADVEVVAICDPDPVRAAARASEFGIAQTFHEAGEMLDRVRPDALDVVAPVEAHGALCLLAADRGVHVLCQKPLATTLAEAQAVVAELRNRVRLMVHENWRFRPHYRQVRRWIDAGDLGAPLSALLRVRSSGLIADAQGAFPQLERQPFFATLERLLIGEVLIHHLDVLRWLLGPLRVVAARAGRRCEAVRGEDHAQLMLSGAGVSAVIDASLVVPGAGPKPLDSLELLGTDGAVTLGGSVLRLEGRRRERVELDLDAAYRASYAGVIRHFVHCLRTGFEFETGPQDNLQTLALVEQAYAACAASESLPLDLSP